MRKLFYFSLLLCAGLFTSCKKNRNTEGTEFDLVRDSVFLYAKETYYWYDALPSYENFQPRSFSGSTDIAALQAEVDAISQYKIDPATGNPFEYSPSHRGQSKYSFIDNGQTNATLGGSRADFGMAVTAMTDLDLRIRYVYPGSSAGNAGVKRGEQIVKINGRTGFDVSKSNDYNFVVSAIGTTPLSMTLKRGDGTTYDVTLNAAAYTTNPVLTYKIFNTTNIAGAPNPTGYLVFNSFTILSNAKPKLDEAFNAFAAAGVKDLVIDFRYNGGGYGETAQYLCNLIVPPAKNGAVMYRQYYNDILANGKAVLLKNQWRRDQNNKPYNLKDNIDYSLDANTELFAKAGSLNLSRVFFIVGSSTASASELVINSLKPHLDVKLIGRNTVGKPVGFFDIRINKYYLYIVQSEAKNADKQGGYFTGMNPGSAEYPGVNDSDDLTKDFGDVNERLLSHALNYVRTGSYGQTLRVESNNSQLSTQVPLGKKEFEGVIFSKPGHLKNR